MIRQILLIFAVGIVFYTGPVSAREEYAEQTGKDCQECHIDPSGGAELTSAGKEFKSTLNSGFNELSPLMSLVRLIAGYLHILTAFFWFGTILYVHIILKPAYASHGLPRGEVRVGLVSMVFMAVTGFTLSLFRFSSFSMLFSTRTGILFTIKIGLFLTMVLGALFAVLYVGPRMRSIKGKVSGPAHKDMVLEELRQYNGKNGNPAYIAYRDQIYDVSASGIWLGGIHFFRHPAGTDLTKYLSQAPHDEERVLKMPKIGMLLDTTGKKQKTKLTRLFYLLTYFNLVLVLMILLIIALIRWGF